MVRCGGAGRPVLQRHRAGVDAAMIMQKAQKEVEQAEQDAIKSAEYNLEQARTKATTRRAFRVTPRLYPIASTMR